MSPVTLSALVHFYPSMNQRLKRDMNELNTTNINFKDFDLQITLRETTEDTGLLFRYNTHITSKDIRMTYVKALWYSISTIFKMNHKYQKFSWNVFLMMCAIMKTFGKLFEKYLREFFFLDSSMSGSKLQQRNWKWKLNDILTVSCSVRLYRNLPHWQ